MNFKIYNERKTQDIYYISKISNMTGIHIIFCSKFKLDHNFLIFYIRNGFFKHFLLQLKLYNRNYKLKIIIFSLLVVLYYTMGREDKVLVD
jgi:hypothetical protein